MTDRYPHEILIDSFYDHPGYWGFGTGIAFWGAVWYYLMVTYLQPEQYGNAPSLMTQPQPGYDPAIIIVLALIIIFIAACMFATGGKKDE